MPGDGGGRDLTARDVMGALARSAVRAGMPEHLRSDNGPEFIAAAVKGWLTESGAATLYIEPGSPWENAYSESFNSRLRDELLNGEVFGSLKEAEVLFGGAPAGVQPRPAAQFAGVRGPGGVRSAVCSG